MLLRHPLREQQMLRQLIFALVLVLSQAATVAAAPKRPAPSYDPGQEKVARAHFDRAEKAFNLRKFDEALGAYQAAYEALPLPAFLFNIAQCHRNLRNREQAVFFYERYLSLAPDAPNRQVVEDLIAEQKHQIEAQPVEAGERPVDLQARPEPSMTAVAHVGEPAPPRRDHWKTTRWWLAGGLAAGLVAGVAIFALRPTAPLPTGSLATFDARHR
jgi:tetratricopeptide (TPR) repeat protein